MILGPLLVLLVLFGRGGIAGAIERWRRGELSVARLRAGVETLASATRAHIVREWSAAVAIGQQLRDKGGPLAMEGLARIATRWRRWNMALGEALVSLVLLVDRGIAKAFVRWRRR